MLLGPLLLFLTCLGGFLLPPGKAILTDRRIDLIAGIACWLSVVLFFIIF